MKRLSWKYLAGLVDGEGCIDFQVQVDKRNKVKTLYIRPRLRITFADNSLFVLEIIKANHGGNIWPDRKSQRNPNWSDAHYWQIQGKQMQSFLQNIIKHLIIKKEQAIFALWWINNVMGKELYNHLAPESNVLKQFARDEMKAMKADPQRLSEVAVRKLKSYGYGLWSACSNHCLSCRTNKKPHEAKGLCRKCYDERKWQKTKLQRAEATV